MMFGRLQDTGGLAQSECSEGGSRQAHWKRRQPRRTGVENFRLDGSLKDPAFRQCDEYLGPGVFRVGPRLLQTAGRQDSHMGALDQLTLRHMAQDCSSVKTQLLKLKSLLQMEDGDLEQETLESTEDDKAALQVEELTRAVQELRHELRNKERIIAKLTQQNQQQQPAALLSRSPCQQRGPPLGSDRRTRHNKTTQTPWRSPTGAPFFSPWQGQYQRLPHTSMPQHRQTSNITAFQPLSQQSPHPGNVSKTSPHRGPQ